MGVVITILRVFMVSPGFFVVVLFRAKRTHGKTSIV